MQVSDWSLPGSTPPITDNEDRMRWPRHPPDLPLVILQGDGDGGDDNKNYHIAFIFTHYKATSKDTDSTIPKELKFSIQ